MGKTLYRDNFIILTIILYTIFILTFTYYHHNYLFFKSFNNYEILLEFIIPIFIIIFIFKKRVKDFGLGIGNIRIGIIISIIYIILYLPIIPIWVRDVEVLKYYGENYLGLSDFFSEMGEEFIAILCCEFFFRGFLIFGLKEIFGDWNAIFIQLLPYVLLHFTKPEIECWGSILVGAALGYLAIRANSIWYGLLLHWTIGGFLDFLINF